ncbi:unnamed protein product [Jaminaea pallidilutea]
MDGRPYFVPLGSNGGEGPSTSSATQASSLDFTGHTLLLPTVSHASIPQLAVDLLLYHEDLALRRVGRLDVSRNVIPFIGQAEDAAGGLVTAMEVYTNPTLNLTVVQQRSPVLKERKREFVEHLAEWARTAGFVQCLLLGSIDASLKTDAELGVDVSPIVHVIASRGDGRLLVALESSSKSLLPDTTEPHRNKGNNGGDTAVVRSLEIPVLPSSTGLLRRLLLALSPQTTSSSAASSNPSLSAVAALVYWAEEGDNRPDAHMLANAVLQHVLPVIGSDQASTTGITKKVGDLTVEEQARANGESMLKEPPSWKGLFGDRRSDVQMYG